MFVGTITAVQNDGTTATVTVDERWKAADSLRDVVQVEQAPDATGATSRKYTRGQWLFDVTYGAPYLEDHACSATSPGPTALGPYRPKGVVKSDGTPQDRPFDLFDMFASDDARADRRARGRAADRGPRLHPHPAPPATAARVDALTGPRHARARAISARSASSVGARPSTSRSTAPAGRSSPNR